MNSDKNNPRLAVLIDADNTFKVIDIIDELFEEISKFGEASVRRIYGDWTQNHLIRWKEVLPKHVHKAHRRERAALIVRVDLG